MGRLGAGPLDATAVRDTLAAVFRGSAFSERSWGQLLLLRLRDLLRTLFGLVRGTGVTAPGVFWTMAALAVALAAAVAVRILVRREALPRRHALGTAPGGRGDVWMDADAAAREGHYDVAAHRLYAAVVGALARAGLVRAHASKTAGDYLRELRRTGPGTRGERPDAAQAFAPFARGYQAVVYGPRAVDRERYEALRTSALPVLEQTGA